MRVTGYWRSQKVPHEQYMEKQIVGSPTERMRLRMQCMSHLKSLLPIHEAEQRVEELEAKLLQLLQLIEHRAPSLLAGDPGDCKTPELRGVTPGRCTRHHTAGSRGRHTHRRTDEVGRNDANPSLHMWDMNIEQWVSIWEAV